MSEWSSSRWQRLAEGISTAAVCRGERLRFIPMVRPPNPERSSGWMIGSSSFWPRKRRNQLIPEPVFLRDVFDTDQGHRGKTGRSAMAILLQVVSEY